MPNFNFLGWILSEICHAGDLSALILDTYIPNLKLLPWIISEILSVYAILRPSSGSSTIYCGNVKIDIRDPHINFEVVEWILSEIFRLKMCHAHFWFIHTDWCWFHTYRFSKAFNITYKFSKIYLWKSRNMQVILKTVEKPLTFWLTIEGL